MNENCDVSFFWCRTQTINIPITFPLIVTKPVPIRQGSPHKTGPHTDNTKLGNYGGIRMPDEPEPHVYELKVPDDLELLKVIRIGDHTVQIELRGKNLRLMIQPTTTITD